MLNRIALVFIASFALAALVSCGGPGPAEREFQLVFFGDSLMDAPGVPAEQRYPQLIEKKLRPTFSNWTVINAGVGGNTTEDGLARISNHLHKEGVIFICLGGNDFLQGKSSADAKVNLTKLIQISRAHGLYPILGGLKGPAIARAVGMVSGSLIGNRNTLAFETMIQEVAKEQFVPLLENVLAPLPLSSWLDTLTKVTYYAPDHMYDMIHPNEKGHRLIADHVFEFVKREIAVYEKMKAVR